MEKDNSYWILKIRKRPFYIWIFRFLWVVWLVFWAEVALGSKAELEPKAFVISMVIFFVSLLIGLVLWLLRIKRFKE